jgi:hypothetical protein
MAERDIETVGEVADRFIGETAPLPTQNKADIVELSTGVVLKIMPVSPMAFGELEEKYPAPKVPKSFDEARGREIENPMHPEYKRQVQQVENSKAIAALDLAIVLGTTLVSHPTEMMGPDSEDWQDRLFALGYSDKIIASKTSRYLAWVKYVASPGEADFNKLSMAVMRRMGVPEPDVNAALKSFPDKQA